MRALSIGLLLCLAGPCPGNDAEPLRLAVASSFRATAGLLGEAFERRRAVRVTVSAAATGVHVAQIRHGLPADVLLAADSLGPRRLERLGHGLPGTRVDYAIGRLAWFGPRTPLAALGPGSSARVALANPRHAPFGTAAAAVLDRLGLPAGSRVYGNNAEQALLMADSGAADGALVAWSQVRDRPEAQRRAIPADWYPPIRQQAIQLRDRPLAAEFLAFLRSGAGREIIRAAGYALPGEPGQ